MSTDIWMWRQSFYIYTSLFIVKHDSKKGESETIRLQKLQRTHSIELIHAVTVMYENSITRKILHL